jgi:hypothetical protein
MEHAAEFHVRHARFDLTQVGFNAADGCFVRLFAREVE